MKIVCHYFSILGCLLLTALSPASWAIGEIQDASELALLPTYCMGTEGIRLISHDPKPVEEYVAMYGEIFRHLGFYCAALNAENNLHKINDHYLKKSELNYILNYIQYVLIRAPATFSLLPEIYLSKARILFKLDRDVDAIGVLFELTKIKPDYGPAYEKLGDYYQRIGDKHNAIKYFEQGLLNTNKENFSFFIKKINQLDKNYKIPNMADHHKTLRKKSADPEIVKSDAPEHQQEKTLTPTLQSEEKKSPADSAPPPNPYCRFCP